MMSAELFPVMPSRGRLKVWAAFKAALWEAHGGLCGICRQPVALADMHIDHIVARTAGGSNEWGNLQPSHQPCNSSKGGKRKLQVAKGIDAQIRGIDRSLWRQLGAAAILQDKAIGYLLNEILKEWLARQFEGE